MWRLESQDVLLIHRYVIFKSGCYHKSSKIFCWLATFFYFIKLVSSPVIYDSNVNMFYFVECVFELETLKWEGGMQLLQSFMIQPVRRRKIQFYWFICWRFVYLPYITNVIQFTFLINWKSACQRKKSDCPPTPPPLKKKQQT